MHPVLATDAFNSSKDTLDVPLLGSGSLHISQAEGHEPSRQHHMKRDKLKLDRPASLGRSWPACVGMEGAAERFGWPENYVAILVSDGHLPALGKPAQNGRKWFSTYLLDELSCDPAWLDKAIRIVQRKIQAMNQQAGRAKPPMGEAPPASRKHEIARFLEQTAKDGVSVASKGENV